MPNPFVGAQAWGSCIPSGGRQGWSNTCEKAENLEDARWILFDVTMGGVSLAAPTAVNGTVLTNGRQMFGNTTVAQHFLAQAITYPNGMLTTFRAHVKKGHASGTLDFAGLSFVNFGFITTCIFNLDLGTVTTTDPAATSTPTITAVSGGGGGWFEIAYTILAPLTGTAPIIAFGDSPTNSVAPYAGDPAEGNIWTGVQVCASSSIAINPEGYAPNNMEQSQAFQADSGMNSVSGL